MAEFGEAEKTDGSVPSATAAGKVFILVTPPRT
jgi:hypothetical protein